jgi:hypothetical protein
MERELWTILSAAVQDVKRSRRANAYHTYDNDQIVRIYLWAVLHDRPVSWACRPESWDDRTRPAALPHQCTVSRRLRSDAVIDFLRALGRRLIGRLGQAWRWLKIIDAKPLTVAAHSKDPDARWGRGAGQKAKGYKLYAVIDGSPMPHAWQVHPMNHDEKTVARTLLPQLRGEGYVVGDKMYDASPLFDSAAQHGHRLIAPRKNRFGGLGKHRHSPHRLACIESLEAPESIRRDGLARHLMRCRKRIETAFANLTSFAAGLTHLPPWVRRLHRVRLYVHAKLIINAARITRIHA